MYHRVIGTCAVSPAMAILGFECKARILLHQMNSSLHCLGRTKNKAWEPEAVAEKVELKLSL